MMKSVIQSICFLAALALSLGSVLAASPDGGTDIAAGMKGNDKLIDSGAVLAGFSEGAAEIKVIVLLDPSDQARKLAGRSALSVPVPAEFKRPQAPAFYNLRDLAVRQQLRATVTENVARIIDQLGPEGIKVSQRFSYQFGFAAQVTAAALERILNNPEVVLVEKDHPLQPHLAQGIPLMNAAAPRSSYDGSGLSIAICDSGIDTSHPRLGGGGFPNAKVIGGYDTADNDPDPRPLATGNAHGTACAGIAAGSPGTVGDYIGGVAPGAKLYALKTRKDSGESYISYLIAAWEWIISHQYDDPANPILIVSNSIGGMDKYTSNCDDVIPAVTTAAANAVAAGLTLFVSAGNEGHCDGLVLPACVSYVNSVGAVYDGDLGYTFSCVDANSCVGSPDAWCTSGAGVWDDTAPDMVTSYSNSASYLTLLAPADYAHTPDIVGSGGYSSGDYYSYFNGTSAASPYAAGAAAVLQSAAQAVKGSYLTPSQVQHYLVANGDLNLDPKSGLSKPRINLANAVDALTAFPWGMFLPALTGRGATAAPAAYWGAISYVYCSSSTTTFSLTSEGITRKSVMPAGGSAGGSGTFEGWGTTTPGSKSFNWQLVSPTCGTWSNSFSYPLLDGKNYLFSLELDALSQPAVYVYTGTGNPTTAASPEAKSSGAPGDAMQPAGRIPLAVPAGVFQTTHGLIEKVK